MSIKSIIKEKGISVKKLSEDSGLPYSTVNDIVNGIISVDNVGLGKCKAISDCLGISLDDFYKAYNNVIAIAPDAEVIVKNHSYYFKTNEEEKYMFKVNSLNSSYVKEAAEWEYEDIVKQRELGEIAKRVMKSV